MARREGKPAIIKVPEGLDLFCDTLGITCPDLPGTPLCGLDGEPSSLWILDGEPLQLVQRSKKRTYCKNLKVF